MKKVKEIMDSGNIGRILSTSLVSLVPKARVLGPRSSKANVATTSDSAARSSMMDIAIGHHPNEIDGEEGTIRLTDDQMSAGFVHIRDSKLYWNGELVEAVSTGLMRNLAAGWAEFAKGKEGHATIDDAVKMHQVIDAITLSV
ncbi:hypothetical protein IW261DRAFT_1557900 [Armillaria novae-zelandiae]|uniref:Uncharacterized protein n=1 Tax=Armillaria novae-zelandiae TaxID=153914 RepID=A0AA39PUH5_9AGAR|nr:hypothetical protein IW261DRAFT_1557900 [Armillaria novae-zelandiae]